MTAYEMQLTNRARLWALLLRARLGDEPVSRAVLVERDVADGEALLARLFATGLAEAAACDGGAPGVCLTALGAREADRTLASGRVPSVVQHDPAEWRLRAWTAARILRRFTAADLARHASAPSLDAVQRYCARLARAGVARAVGTDAERRTTYALVQDPGPGEPVQATARRAVAPPDAAVYWRERAWRACLSLGAAGQGFTSAEVVALAGVPERRTRYLLETLVRAGALAQVRRVGCAGRRAGREWLYALSLDAEARAEAVVARSAWQAVAWRMLREADEGAGGSPMRTAQQLADEVGGVGSTTVRDWLDALVDAGLAVSEDTHASSDKRQRTYPARTYRAAPGASESVPDVCGRAARRLRREGAAAVPTDE